MLGNTNFYHVLLTKLKLYLYGMIKVINVITLLFVFTLVFVQGCKKDLKVPETPTVNLNQNVSSINEMVVNDAFNYIATKNISITVSVADAQFGNRFHIIFIYTMHPDAGGNLLASGSARINEPFTSSFLVPAALNKLTVVRVDPNGERIIEEIDAVSGTINHTLLRKNIQLFKKTGPDCNSGCSTTINNQSNQNLNLNSGTTCITGTFSGSITLSGNAEVRICGNAEINNININSTNATVTISSSAIVEFKSTVSLTGTFTNYGEITFKNNLNLNNNANFTNEGSLTIDNNLNANGSSNLLNNGSLLVDKNYTNNSGSIGINNCKLIIAKDFTNNGNYTNNGYLSCSDDCRIQGGSGQDFTLSSSAMLSVRNLWLNAILTANSNSLIKVSKNTRINSNGGINGPAQLCDIDGIEQNNGTLSGGVVIGCNRFIATSNCNPEGNGVNQDSDNDGIPNSMDNYPNNNNQAFDNYYPGAANFASVAFEDLWPNKGDFDLNDIVVDFKHNIISNADNEPVSFSGTYIYRARGGTFKNAFAVEFPFNLSDVDVNSLQVIIEPEQNATVTAAVKFETNNSKACLQIFDDSKIINWMNTVQSQPRADTIVFRVSFNFTSTFSQSNTINSMGGVNEFNPFIWVNEPNKGRGHEIHLPGKSWTSLCNTSTFGFADDNTNPSGTGVKYKTKNNLPFAVLTPSRFLYPVEVRMAPVPQINPPVDITQIYLHFAQWAQSNGQLYPDWFSNNASGYRTTQPWIFNY